MIRLAAILVATCPLGACAQHAAGGPVPHAGPYAGLEVRPVAALSAEDVESLLAGRGMGYALSAELNGHPGPLHLLELAPELALTEAQVAAIAAIRDRMAAEARAQGASLVEAERAIDAAFEAGGLDRAELAGLVAEAGRIEAGLRTTHLAAHLEVLPLLTAGQVAAYDRLRGYAAAPPPHEH